MSTRTPVPIPPSIAKLLPDNLRNTLRKKDWFRGVFVLLGLAVGILRVLTHGFTVSPQWLAPFQNARAPILPTSIIVLMVVGLSFLTYGFIVIFWHLLLYDYLIVPFKDRVCRVLRVQNYRQWIETLRPPQCDHFRPEEIYGILKWEKEVRYPHIWGNIVTPVIHTSYITSLFWLLTLAVVHSLDPLVITAALWLPATVLLDIAWEQKETTVFKQYSAIVRKVIRKQCGAVAPS